MGYRIKINQTGGNISSKYANNYTVTGVRQYGTPRKTIYDNNPVDAFNGLLGGWNGSQVMGINDLSPDQHLGGQEVNNFLRNIHFDERSIDSRYGKGTLNRWKDTFKRWVNNRISGNAKYSDSQMAADKKVLTDLMQEVNEQYARYDPLTKNKIYYGQDGYDKGVSANDWQAANQQYTTARDAYAKSLIEKKYKEYLNKSLNNPSAWDNSKYGTIGEDGLSQENVYRLIQYAGDNAASGLTLGKGKSLKDYGGDQLNNFKFGDHSKDSFERALNYYKAYNPALYNAIVTNKNFTTFIKQGSSYDKLNNLEFTTEGMNNWWNTKGKIDDSIVGELNGLVNDTSNVADYIEKQKQIPQKQNTPKQYSVSDITLSFKQGGKMNKYQQGGQAPTAAQMVLQALSAAQQGDQSGLQQLFSDKKTAQAVIQQLQKEAQEGSEEAIQALEALKQLMGGSKKQATMAQKGAKLSYIHRLATGCPPGMEMTYFKKGGRLCKACIEKAKKAKEGASLDNIIAKNKKRYPGITNDQAAGRAPIRKNGKDYYLGGDGVLSEAPQRSKYGFGGFFEYFKCGGKPKKPKCGTKAKCGAELEKCGGKTPMDKCGGKTPMTKCGGKAPMDKCGGKTTLAKCGTELKKCGGKAKKSSPKKPVVNKDKCGGKAKKHAIGGNLELLKYMILNYNK